MRALPYHLSYDIPPRMLGPGEAWHSGSRRGGGQSFRRTHGSGGIQPVCPAGFWGQKKHIIYLPPFVYGIVPETNRICPRDKPGEIGLPLCKIRRKPGVSQVFTGFVPGTNPVKSPGQTRGVPRPTGQKNLCLCVIWIQGGFTAESPRNDSGASFQ